MCQPYFTSELKKSKIYQDDLCQVLLKKLKLSVVQSLGLNIVDARNNFLHYVDVIQNFTAQIFLMNDTMVQCSFL